MKTPAILLIFSFFLSMTVEAQTSDWFVVLTPGYAIGGPGVSIKANVNKSGFNRSESNWLFGGSIAYPQAFHDPAFFTDYWKTHQPKQKYLRGYGANNERICKGV